MAASVFALLTAMLLPSLHSQELLFEETFESDGKGTRYEIEGGDLYEVERIKDELGIGDQEGPIYWSRSSEVSFVGVPAPAPDKRAILAWHHDIPADSISDGFFKLFDATIAWLAAGKEDAKILYAGTLAEGDLALIEHLEGTGYTVLEDDLVGTPDPDDFDLAIKSSSAANFPSRFVKLAAPMLTFDGASHDDELVSSIGAVVSTQVEMGSIVSGEHPAAGGIEGSFELFDGTWSLNLVGEEIPGDATVVANFERVIPATVDRLSTVDGLIDGTIPSTKESGILDAADMVGGAPAFGVFFDDEALPGDPTEAFAAVATGKLVVDAAGTYSIGLGIDDGDRLRVDLDGNGLNASDDVLVEDATGAFRYVTDDVDFPAGTFDFQWVAFNSGGDFGAELAVGLDENGNSPEPVDDVEWELLSSKSGNLKLDGEIAVDVFFNEGEAETEVRPLLVVIESGEDGGSVFGGGPFVGFEGQTFFAGSGLNKFDNGEGEVKSLVIGPIDVAGKTDLELTLSVGATFLDFETSDFLDVSVDPDGNGDDDFTRLIHFTAPSGNDKFFDDKGTNAASPTRLGLQMRDVSYSIPDGATELVIKIDALTTWWNEIVAFDNIRVTAGGGAAKQGGNVVWITEQETDNGMEYLELLRNDGHTVTEITTTDPTDEELAMMNAADVVVMSRKVNSGSYNSEFWDEEITAPMLVLTPYVLRDNRWGWFEGNGLTDDTPDEITAEEPGHPLFEGIPLNNGVSTAWHTEVDRGTSFITEEVIADGTLLASAGDSVVAAEWPAGAVATGRRMLLSMGSREFDGEPIDEAGKYAITPLGEIALLNAIRIFTPNAGPSTNFAITGVTYDSANKTITLTWNSLSNATYAIESASTLQDWEELDDGVQSDGQSTSFTTPAQGREAQFRVRQE
jgi:hypothetical protein